MLRSPTRRLTGAFALALACLAARAAAAPVVSPRVELVAQRLRPASELARPGDDRAVLLGRVRDDAVVARLAAAGLTARPLAPGFVEVVVSAADLDRLLADGALSDGLLHLEERQLLRPTLDRAAAAVHAPQARAQLGHDGSGVLVGVVDTGLDLTHPDLRTAEGKTRVAALLDVGSPDPGDHPEFGPLPGQLVLADVLDASIAAGAPVSTDKNGHGTHVSSIAVGNGLATGNQLPAGRYVGVAPGASLLVLKATRAIDTFFDTDILASCKFADLYASRVGKPLVLNLSLGGPGGPNDGTTGLEAGLDALFPPTAPGRAFVVAAGNDGGLDVRAGSAIVDRELAVPVLLTTVASGKGAAYIQLWSDGGALAITVETPDHRRTPAATPGQAFSADAGAYGKISIDNQSAADPTNGRRRALVVLEPAFGHDGGDPAQATWTLHLAPAGASPVGRWDATMTEWPSPGPRPRFTSYVAVDGRLNLPATARGAIAVGSWVTRGDWINVDGVAEMRNVTVGAPSTFTASGPTADGRFAPDVAAPGEMVLAALSVDAPPSSRDSAFYVAGMPHYTIADDGVHAALLGTSQAAPFVSGAIALLFQGRPTLTSDEAREILRAAAQPPPLDDASRSAWSTRAGFGLLDVAMADAIAAGRWGDGAPDPALSTVGVSRDQLAPASDELARVSVVPRDATGVPLGPGHAVAIEISAGTPIGPVVDLGWGRYERMVAPASARGTVGTVTAWVDAVELGWHPTIAFVRDRSEIGGNFAVAGGCSAAPGDPSPLAQYDGQPGGRPVALMRLGAAILGGLLSFLLLRRARRARRRR